MRVIPLQTIPNQTLNLVFGELRYALTLKETEGVMSVTVTRDDVIILSGARIVAGTPFIPYKYKQDGNFIFLTQNGDLPDYNKFNTTQTLIYISAEELAAL